MRNILIAGGILIIWLLFKLIMFFKRGGTFTQTTRNVSFLYFQAKLIYPKLDENAIRYLAILINTSTNRTHFSKNKIAQLVLAHSEKNWGYLCTEYTWKYSESCGGPPRHLIDINIVHNFNNKITQNISWVKKRVNAGNFQHRNEMILREIPQFELMSIIVELEKHQQIASSNNS